MITNRRTVQVKQNCMSVGGKMMRIAVTPEWVHIMDFNQRFPSEIEAVMAG